MKRKTSKRWSSQRYANPFRQIYFEMVNCCRTCVWIWYGFTQFTHWPAEAVVESTRRIRSESWKHSFHLNKNWKPDFWRDMCERWAVNIMWHKNCFALLIARWLALSTHAVYKWNPNTSFILWKHVIPCVIFFGLSNLFERLCCTRGVLRWSDALTTEYVLTNSLIIPRMLYALIIVLYNHSNAMPS